MSRFGQCVVQGLEICLLRCACSSCSERRASSYFCTGFFAKSERDGVFVVLCVMQGRSGGHKLSTKEEKIHEDPDNETV